MKRFFLITFLLLTTIITINSEIAKQSRNFEKFIKNQQKEKIFKSDDTSKLLFIKSINNIKNFKILKAGNNIFQGFKTLFSNPGPTYLFFINFIIIFYFTIFFTILLIIFIKSLKYSRTLIYKYLSFLFKKKYVALILFLKFIFYIIYLLGGWLIFSLLTLKLYKSKELKLLAVLFILMLIPLLFFVLKPSFINYPQKQKNLLILDKIKKENLNNSDIIFLNQNSFFSNNLKNFLLARHYSSTRQSSAAVKFYKDILNKNYSHYSILNNYANSLIKTNNYKEAEKYYNTAFKKSKSNFKILFNLSKLFSESGEPEISNFYYSKAGVLKNNLPKITEQDYYRIKTPNYFLITRVFKQLFNTKSKINQNLKKILLGPIIIIFLILLLSFIISKINKKLSPITNCYSCNTPILPDSAYVEYSRNKFCPYCQKIIINPRYPNLISYGKKHFLFITFIKSLILNIILPGLGLIYSNINIIGTLILIGSIFLFVPSLFSGLIITHSFINLILVEKLIFLNIIFMIVSNIIILVSYFKNRSF